MEVIFSPFPKNPIIARVFKEIGWVDELGSGVRNIYKYSKFYSGEEPELIEEDIFKIIIPITPQASEREIRIIEFCREAKSKNEILEFLGLKDRKHFMKNILQPLIDSNKIKLTIPEKPRSPRQKYYS